MSEAPKSPPPVAPATPAKYRVQDDELLLDFYKKLLWNRIIPRIPAGITPNTLTILGQICAMLSVIATGAAVAGAPIFYLVSAFLLLTYLTFDNIDGAHARRTGQTSHLGEFLDHGLDGLASASILIVTGFVLTIDQSWPVVPLCLLGPFSFVRLFWERFRTATDLIRLRCETYFKQVREARTASLPTRTARAMTRAPWPTWAPPAGAPVSGATAAGPTAGASSVCATACSAASPRSPSPA